ncbi:hypothetical protein DYU05_18220 [Mucilaginibacter terrenus]|uniref:Uncharacterized protein n=1 Tax=Mucilaginibacter terrenus TaxID=2482727 RepID=A0A3E2NL81_9SPHI|nr:hypothetical protein [Mucilaginibacter terrenus]RFZ81757.1 hypothetical protein DYU05_18220 [Mucilaginibacter terrenus]
MTTTTRFYIALIAAIASVIVFILSTYTLSFGNGEPANFLQGFSGGLGFGSFLGVITYGIKLRKEKQERLAA